MGFAAEEELQVYGVALDVELGDRCQRGVVRRNEGGRGLERRGKGGKYVVCFQVLDPAYLPLCIANHLGEMRSCDSSAVLVPFSGWW